jgi:dihydroxy-acid dehydratase
MNAHTYKTLKRSDFAILHGSLATGGCVLRLGHSEAPVIQGLTRVFSSTQAALGAIEAGLIRAGHIMVLKLSVDVAIVTQAMRMSGLDHITLICEAHSAAAYAGPMVLGITPTTAQDGAIGLIEDEDVIRIDVAARTIDSLTDMSGRAIRPSQPKKAFGPAQKYAAFMAANA